jgi:hypothetical protein
LNQRGLFKDVFRDKKTGEKKTAGVKVACKLDIIPRIVPLELTMLGSSH